MQPIAFQPIYQKRIWGGRLLETRYHRSLPTPHEPYGEAWEIVDRPEAQSIVSSGALKGKSLNLLWTKHREEIFGPDLPETPRFPLLIKILDCAKDLSIQVHPPAHIAQQLGGEPKTEQWFIADAAPSATLHVGLRRGTNRTSFEKAIQNGTVANLVHTIQPEIGQSILLKSGRLHAIGAGFLIHEIQQNSDTTYRVFDWNRTEPNGNPRQLHIRESLKSINFEDIEPTMDTPKPTTPAKTTLTTCQHFKTTQHTLQPGETIQQEQAHRFSLLTIVDGKLNNTHKSGQTILIPPNSPPLKATSPASPTTLLEITIP